MGYSWPGVFLLGASGRTGRFFTQLLFHDPISISLWSSSLELCYLDCILRFYDMSCILVFSWINRALGLKQAAPKVCVLSCWNKLRCRGERNSYFAGTATRGLGRVEELWLAFWDIYLVVRCNLNQSSSAFIRAPNFHFICQLLLYLFIGFWQLDFSYLCPRVVGTAADCSRWGRTFPFLHKVFLGFRIRRCRTFFLWDSCFVMGCFLVHFWNLTDVLQ